MSQVSFTDPGTGITYGAILATGGPLDADSPGLAARLVLRGVDLETLLNTLPPDDPDRPRAMTAFARTVKDAEFLRSTFNLIDSVTLGAP